VRRTEISGFSLLLALTLLAAPGCGGRGSADESGGGVFSAAAVRSCLVAAAADVLENNPDYVDGDASSGTFHVAVDDNYATVAFAANETNAVETARRAQQELESGGDAGELVHHRGNVAYWQLDESDAPVRVVETCLEETPTEESEYAQF
jgi:hypothetical protein